MSLNIVWENKEGKKVHECDVCHKIDVWSKGWEAWVFGIGVGWKGEEKTFITCSDKCRKEEKEKKLFLLERIKLHNRWWECYGDDLDKSEKKFKKLMDEEYEKQLKNG